MTDVSEKRQSGQAADIVSGLQAIRALGRPARGLNLHDFRNFRHARQTASWALFCALAACTAPAEADRDVLDAIAYVEANTTYRRGAAPLPTVHYVRRDALVRMSGRETGHGHAAAPYAYYDGDGRIFIWQGVTNDVNRRAMLVHEGTHWLQGLRGGPDMDCSGNREWEAYVVHANFLEDHGIVYDWDWPALRADKEACQP